MRADAKTKSEARKAGFLAFIAEMERYRLGPLDCVEMIAEISATICDSEPKPLDKNEAIAFFVATFARTMRILNQGN